MRALSGPFPALRGISPNVYPEIHKGLTIYTLLYSALVPVEKSEEYPQRMYIRNPKDAEVSLLSRHK